MVRFVWLLFIVAAVVAVYFWLAQVPVSEPKTDGVVSSVPQAESPVVVPQDSPLAPRRDAPPPLPPPPPSVARSFEEPMDMEERKSLVAAKQEQIRELMDELPAVRFDEPARQALERRIEDLMEEYDRLVLPAAVAEVQAGNEAER